MNIPETLNFAWKNGMIISAIIGFIFGYLMWKNK